MAFPAPLAAPDQFRVTFPSASVALKEKLEGAVQAVILQNMELLIRSPEKTSSVSMVNIWNWV
jgi:hypothetical protein